MTVVDIAISPLAISFFFFFNDTATTEIYTLSLHDALPIYRHAARESRSGRRAVHRPGIRPHRGSGPPGAGLRGPPLHHRSEEHTSELQSQSNLVCRLLLEKKKITHMIRTDARLQERRSPHV